MFIWHYTFIRFSKIHSNTLISTSSLLGTLWYLLKFLIQNQVKIMLNFTWDAKNKTTTKKWEQKCQMTQEFFLNVSCRRENAVNHWANLGQFPLFSIQWEMRCAFIGQKWCYILLALGGKLTVSFPVTHCSQPRVRRRWRARHAQRRKYASIHK